MFWTASVLVPFNTQEQLSLDIHIFLKYWYISILIFGILHTNDKVFRTEQINFPQKLQEAAVA